MVFAAELDDVRQQIRQGAGSASNVIAFWPSAAGAGNVLVTGTPTYEIRKDTTAAIISGNATATTVDGVTKITVGIDASSATTYELKENYSAIFTWEYASMTHVSTIRFDCVLEPVLPGLGVTLNDLIEEVVDMDERLTRQAEAQASGRTAEQHASVLAIKAWGDLRRWLKSSAEASGNILPRLIVDREALKRVVVARALARAYRAEGGGIDSESRQNFDDWSAEALDRFHEMGSLAFDSNEDGIPDTEIGGWSTVQTRRAW